MFGLIKVYKQADGGKKKQRRQKRKREGGSVLCGWMEKKLHKMTTYYIILPQNALWRIRPIIYLWVYLLERERQGDPGRVRACNCEQYLGLRLRGV